MVEEKPKEPTEEEKKKKKQSPTDKVNAYWAPSEYY